MRLNHTAADYLKKRKRRKGKDRDNELWTLVKNEYDLGLELRRPYERVWMLCLSYLASKQYVLFNSTMHQIQNILKRPGKSRIVDNQLLSRWKRQVADLIKNDPEMSVVPNTTDEADRKAAKSGDMVLKHWWRNNQMKKKTRRMAGWIFGTGNVFLADRWNKKLGPTSMGEKGELVYLGDADCDVWSPFEVVVPAYGLNPGELDDMPWMATGKWREFAWMYKRFDKKRVAEISAEEHPSADVNGAVLFGGGTPANATKMTEGAVVIDMRIQPCTEFPKGAHIIASNGIILEHEDFPFTEYSMEHFKDIEFPGSFWGSCEVEHGLGLQNRWNRTLNSVDEFNKTMAKGKWTSPKAAKMEVDPNDEHGEVLLYNPVLGHKPEQVTIKGLPTSYPMILDSTHNSLQDLFNQHEVSRGTNKSDIRSGDMVEILREQDAHGNIPSHMVWEEGMEKVTSRILKRVQAGYTQQRMIKIIGEGSQWEVKAFIGADLRGNTDVSIKRQSSLPDSRVAREAQVLKRFNEGLYGDPTDPEVRRMVMNMIDEAVTKDIFSDTRLDETVARNENELMSQGTNVMFNPYDNHAIHLKEHNHARKSFEYQSLKQTNKQLHAKLEAVAEAHIQMHQKALAEERQRMLEEQKFLADKGGD